MRILAAVSGIYDALVGVMMLAGRPLLVQLFGVPPPVPPIHADLNGVFLLAVAAGYLIPYHEPESYAGSPLHVGDGADAEGYGRYTDSCCMNFLQLSRVVSAVCGQ